MAGMSEHFKISPSGDIYIYPGMSGMSSMGGMGGMGGRRDFYGARV